MANVKVPKLPTIRRLPTYLYKLSEMRKAGVEIVATPELARYMNLGEIVIRKDLALTGVSGQPGVGCGSSPPSMRIRPRSAPRCASAASSTSTGSRS